MPPRKGRRIRPKNAETAKIDRITELVLVTGDGFNIGGPTSLAEYETAWRRWGAEVEKRWCISHPGSRPVAKYVLAEIKPWHQRKTPFDPVPAQGAPWLNCRDHALEPELEHLRRLGVVGDAEYELAVKRLSQDDARSMGRHWQIAGY